VDILENEAAFAIFDYRLYFDPLNLNKVRHGLSLGLLASLAIVQEQSEQLTDKKLSPAAAFYLKLLRQLEKVEHPNKANDPEDPDFHLTHKPRGIFNSAYFTSLDKSCDGESKMISARLTRAGSLGYRHNTDVAEADEFAALLKEVRRQLGRLADQVMDGEIALRPYRMGTTTPCSNCKYRSVCRFDASINRYRHIPSLPRDQVLREIAEEHRE
jgi:ATP-dependent helicase/nuclease subunit B